MSFWKNGKPRTWMLGVLAGIFFFAVGALQGQLGVIWKKAVMICLECIGIG